MLNIDDETYTLLKAKRTSKKNGKTYYVETFTFKSDETSLFPDKKNKTFIEFEIDNIDYSNSDEPKKTYEIVKGYIGNGFDKHKESKEELGTFLLEIMNNYDLFMKTILYDYKNKLFDAKDDWKIKNKIIRNKYKYDYNKYIEERQNIDIKLQKTLIAILQQLLYKLARINPKLGMLRNYIGEYVYEFFTKYPKSIESLRDDIDRIKKKYPNISYKLNNNLTKKEKIQADRLRYNTKLLYQRNSISYIFKKFCIFFSRLADEFRSGKKLIDNSFIYDDGKKDKKFSGIETTLPTAKIEYQIENFTSPKPFKFTYEIRSLKDLFDVTIYQLSLSHQAIIKCKNCEKYFIPPIEFNEKTGKSKKIRNDKVYCSYKCKWQYKSRNRSKDAITIYYEKLRKRYNNNITYHEELEKLKTLYKDCKSKQLDDETIMKILTDFDENVKNTYSVKRGRPPKKQ